MQKGSKRWPYAHCSWAAERADKRGGYTPRDLGKILAGELVFKISKVQENEEDKLVLSL